MSQAYGARNFRYIGIVFQNSLVVACIIYVPIAMAFWFTEPVLLLFKQDAHLAHMAGTYNRWLIPGVLPLLIYRSQTQYLQNQRILKPAIVAGALAVVLSVPLNWVLIYGLPEMKVFGLSGFASGGANVKVLGGWKGFGFIGAPMAGSLTWLAQPIFLWLYVMYTGDHLQSWSGCNPREAFRIANILNFLKLGVPASMMLAMEVVGFEIATLFVGSFKEVAAVKAHAIGFNLTTMVFIVPIGLAIGSTTRVGNRLGSGDPDGARFSAKIGAAIVLIFLIFISFVLIAFKALIPRLYTDSKEIIIVFQKLMPLVAALAFLDGIQTFTGALMRSVGKQLSGSIVNFLGYYLLAIPIAAGLGFGAKWKLFGVWCGLVAGLLGASIGYCTLIARIDWNEEARKAKERVDSGAANSGLVPAIPDAETEYQPLDSSASDIEQNILRNDSFGNIAIKGDIDESSEIREKDSYVSLDSSEDSESTQDSSKVEMIGI